MKSVINIFKIAVKYGAVIMAVINVFKFAIEQFEGIDLKKVESKK
ncbi:hypothetical protein [Thalassobellus citreus]